MSVLHRARDDEFVGQVHVYEPHSAGLPRMSSYLRELWRRRQFAYEMSRTELRAQHFDSVFGMLWLVLNPLLLGLTYFLLVFVIGNGTQGVDFLAHLLGALFAFHFFTQTVLKGTASVTSGGRLLMNTSFPRALLPISAVISGVMRFVPTLIVYAAVHALAGEPVTANVLWALPVFAILVVFTTGLAMFFATLQVYFRDIRSFLPYMLRIWLYLSPVLWTVEKFGGPGGLDERAERIVRLNPMFDIIGAWSQAIGTGRRPETVLMAQGAAWALGAFVVGALYFISREREFAVRL
jgi:teichoic acid transport system permease protein